MAHAPRPPARESSASGGAQSASDDAPSATATTRGGATLRLARWSARHPWRAIGAWVVLVVLAVGVGMGVGTRQLAGSESGSGESAQADRAIEAAAFPTVVTEQVMVSSRGGRLDPAVAGEVVDDLEAAFAQVPQVEQVGDPVPSADGTAVLIPLVLDNGGKTGEEAYAYAVQHIDGVLAATADVQADHPALRVEQAGEASLETAIEAQVAADFRMAEILSLPVTLVILLLAFGALIAAGVPVVLAMTAVASAIGLSALVSQLVPVTPELTSVILLIGMAVGVDYSLFFIRRAREEREKGASTLDTVEIAAATSGRAVLVSGIAVMVAMAGMFISGNAVFVSFGVGTIIVVGVAMLGSLTVLPATLAKLGRWVDRPRVPLVHRLHREGSQGRFWPWAMRVVLARPALSLALGTAALVALALPALSMELRNGGADSLPRSIPAVQTYDRIVAAYPEEGTSHLVAVWDEQGAELDEAALRSAVDEVAAAAEASGLFVSSAPEVEVSPNGQVAVFSLAVPFEPGDPGATESLAALRQEILPAAFVAMPGAETGVTGEVAGNTDFTDQMVQRLPYVIGFVLLLSFVVLTVAFRSVVVAGTAIALNMLSVGAAYGLLVVVFQSSWAEGLLGFTSSGAVIAWLPLFLFVVLFGLSMDYHVFVVSRIREANLSGMPIKQAVAHGVTASAGVVTSAAAVMVGVFSIFATLSLLEFKQLGVGLAAAVLIDATIVRVVLLPSAMSLLGRWNWWMPRVLHRLPHLEAPAPVSAAAPGLTPALTPASLTPAPVPVVAQAAPVSVTAGRSLS